MGIKVKLPSKTKFVFPNMCVACGEPSPTSFVPQSIDQYLTRGYINFPICRRCGQYYWQFRDSKTRKKIYDSLPPEEIKRAYWASHFGGVDVPYFYLGKRVFNFSNDNFGILFWKLNGGEMSEYDTYLGDLNYILETRASWKSPPTL